MIKHEVQRYTAIASVYKALGSPTRFHMIQRLLKDDLCVCELQQPEGVDMSTISRHLSVLRAAGLVVSRKVRTNVIYSISCDEVKRVLQAASGFAKIRRSPKR